MATTITRAQLIAAVEALGLDPFNISELRLEHHQIRVTEFKRNKDGSRIADQDLNEFEKNTYGIPVTE